MRSTSKRPVRLNCELLREIVTKPTVESSKAILGDQAFRPSITTRAEVELIDTARSSLVSTELLVKSLQQDAVEAYSGHNVSK